MMNRRRFIQIIANATAGSILIPSALNAWQMSDEEYRRVTILQTGDLHSRLDTMGEGGKYNPLGVIKSRMTIVNRIRNEAKQVLLFDTGDIFNGSPYFKLYKGEAEIKAMNLLYYDAVTIGEHDFTYGIENYAFQIAKANFPVVITNYDLTDTPLAGMAVPFKTFKTEQVKVGVMGVGIEMKGLIQEHLFGNTIFNDPIAKVNETAERLKKVEKCDMIICLSHLGDWYNDPYRISDAVLAKESYYVDLILSSHTHRSFDLPRRYKNKADADVVVNQTGWAGENVGRLDFEFSGRKNKNLMNSKTVVVGKKTAD